MTLFATVAKNVAKPLTKAGGRAIGKIFGGAAGTVAAGFRKLAKWAPPIPFGKAAWPP